MVVDNWGVSLTLGIYARSSSKPGETVTGLVKYVDSELSNNVWSKSNVAPCNPGKKPYRIGPKQDTVRLEGSGRSSNNLNARTMCRFYVLKPNDLGL